MAYTSNIEVGYDVKIVGNYPTELTCGICTLIIKHATHGCKNHAFCHSCLNRQIKWGIRYEGEVKCPGGCGQVIEPTPLKENIYVDRMVNTLKTKCSNKNCPWQGDLLDLVQVHHLNCNYIKVACPNEGCDVIMLKKDIIHHENECFHKLIRCNFCQVDVTKQKKKEHEFVCSMEIIECQYHDVGCTDKFCRKDSESHELNNQTLHMSFVYKNHTMQLSKCEKELLKSNIEVSQLKKENSEIKITTMLQISQLKEQINKTKNENIPKAHYLMEKLQHALEYIESVIVECISGALYAECLCQKGSFLNIEELSACFESNAFAPIVDYIRIRKDKLLMGELLNEITYHMYAIGCSGYYMFCFPIDLNHLEDFNLKLRDIFIVKLENTVFTVEPLNKTEGWQMDLYIGKYYIKLQSGINAHGYVAGGGKIDLKQVNDSMLSGLSKPFAKGYACLKSYDPEDCDE